MSMNLVCFWSRIIPQKQAIKYKWVKKAHFALVKFYKMGIFGSKFDRSKCCLLVWVDGLL